MCPPPPPLRTSGFAICFSKNCSKQVEFLFKVFSQWIKFFQSNHFNFMHFIRFFSFVIACPFDGAIEWRALEFARKSEGYSYMYEVRSAGTFYRKLRSNKRIVVRVEIHSCFKYKLRSFEIMFDTVLRFYFFQFSKRGHMKDSMIIVISTKCVVSNKNGEHCWHGITVAHYKCSGYISWIKLYLFV